jgi:hypothetical protein
LFGSTGETNVGLFFRQKKKKLFFFPSYIHIDLLLCLRCHEFIHRHPGQAARQARRNTDISESVGGTIYATTPGGTKIVYRREELVHLSKSPLAQIAAAQHA